MDSAGTFATAICFDTTDKLGSGIAQGPAAGPLEVLAQFRVVSSWQYKDQPRLDADATKLYLYDSYDLGLCQYEVYNRQGDGTWMFGSTVPWIPSGSISPCNYSISTIARDAHGDRVMITDGLTIVEWAQDAMGAWQSLAMYTLADLGVVSLDKMLDLSIDGLRLVFSATDTGQTRSAMYIATRASIGDRFGTPTILVGVPLVDSVPFLSPDCARLYIEGLDRIFYVQQR